MFLTALCRYEATFFARESMQQVKLFTAFIISWKSCKWPTIANSNKIPEELFFIHIFYSCPSSASEIRVSQLDDPCS